MAPLAMILLLLFYLAKAQSHRSGNFRGIFRNDVAHLGKKNQTPKNYLVLQMLYQSISEQSYILHIYVYIYEHMHHRNGTENLRTYMASEITFNAAHLGNNKAKWGGIKSKGILEDSLWCSCKYHQLLDDLYAKNLEVEL